MFKSLFIRRKSCQNCVSWQAVIIIDNNIRDLYVFMSIWQHYQTTLFDINPWNYLKSNTPICWIFWDLQIRTWRVGPSPWLKTVEIELLELCVQVQLKPWEQLYCVRQQWTFRSEPWQQEQLIRWDQMSWSHQQWTCQSVAARVKQHGLWPLGWSPRWLLLLQWGTRRDKKYQINQLLLSVQQSQRQWRSSEWKIPQSCTVMR